MGANRFLLYKQAITEQELIKSINRRISGIKKKNKDFSVLTHSQLFNFFDLKRKYLDWIKEKKNSLDGFLENAKGGMNKNYFNSLLKDYQEIEEKKPDLVNKAAYKALDDLLDDGFFQARGIGGKYFRDKGIIIGKQKQTNGRRSTLFHELNEHSNRNKKVNWYDLNKSKDDEITHYNVSNVKGLDHNLLVTAKGKLRKDLELVGKYSKNNGGYTLEKLVRRVLGKDNPEFLNWEYGKGRKLNRHHRKKLLEFEHKHASNFQSPLNDSYLRNIKNKNRNKKKKAIFSEYIKYI